MHDIILRIKQIVSNHHHQKLHTNYVDVCDGNDAITQMKISSQRRKMCVCVCRATTLVCVFDLARVIVHIISGTCANNC